VCFVVAINDRIFVIDFIRSVRESTAVRESEDEEKRLNLLTIRELLPVEVHSVICMLGKGCCVLYRKGNSQIFRNVN